VTVSIAKPNLVRLVHRNASQRADPFFGHADYEDSDSSSN
jgi:hypothetical protein